MSKKKFYLTVDLEEWYHLLYLKKYTDFKGIDFFVHKVDEFLSFLEIRNINCTFFVLAEIARKYPKIIDRIFQSGHEIACHGLNHGLVTDKNDKEFRYELVEAKKILEDIVCHRVKGYRAPCFSLNENKISILQDIGFEYDSSFIMFSKHKLYNQMDMSDFIRINSIIHQSKKYNFLEFQIPTSSFLNMNLPISGGGYMRIIPFILFEKLFINEIKKRDEFLLFVHPFELYNKSFKLPIKVGLKDYLRFHIGRKSNLGKLSKLIEISRSMDFEFDLIGNTQL